MEKCEFCKTGNPNLEGYISWESGAKKSLILCDKETVLSNPSMLKLWFTMFTNKAPGEYS